MPLYLNAPLPGPFRYVRRMGGTGRSWTYWLLLGWWLVPSLVLVRLVVLGTVLLARAGHRAYTRWCR